MTLAFCFLEIRLEFRSEAEHLQKAEPFNQPFYNRSPVAACTAPDANADVDTDDDDDPGESHIFIGDDAPDSPERSESPTNSNETLPSFWTHKLVLKTLYSNWRTTYATYTHDTIHWS